jgi:hypothetical protein
VVCGNKEDILYITLVGEFVAGVLHVEGWLCLSWMYNILSFSVPVEASILHAIQLLETAR